MNTEDVGIRCAVRRSKYSVDIETVLDVKTTTATTSCILFVFCSYDIRWRRKGLGLWGCRGRFYHSSALATEQYSSRTWAIRMTVMVLDCSIVF